MEQDTLIFPDTVCMSDFLIASHPSHIEASTSNLIVRGILSEKQIEEACADYGAVLMSVVSLLED